MKFKTGDRVIYIPLHAHGDPKHKDCETGTVSTATEKTMFVRFDKQVENLGWDGATAQACDPCNLTMIGG